MERFDPVFEAQVLTYMRIANLKLGLLINFNVPLIKDGISRILNLDFQTEIETQRRDDAKIPVLPSVHP